MRYFVVLVVLFGLAAANDTTHNKTVNALECSSSISDSCKAGSQIKCNAVMSGFTNSMLQKELQSYVKAQLAFSYKYLSIASHFNTYVMNRPGFHKLFQSLSDKAWDKGIELIKHITKRGGKIDFGVGYSGKDFGKTLNLDEINSLSLALDIEKKLATTAHHIHHVAQHTHHDPEIAQFLEEEFLEYQADTIRKISGYVNELSKLIAMNSKQEHNAPLSLYLFDEYLAKQ